jgi:hypothetical protein
MPKGIIGIPDQLRELKSRFARKPNGEEPSAPAVDPKPSEKPATP